MRIQSLAWWLAASGITCASHPTAPPMYPARGAGCELAVFSTPVPGVPAWDDLGPVEAVCNINGNIAECLRQLRAEACHRGGDILYDVPAKPMRPVEQALVFRAQVAHTRRAPARPRAPDDEADPDADADAGTADGPVIPLGARN